MRRAAAGLTALLWRREVLSAQQHRIEDRTNERVVQGDERRDALVFLVAESDLYQNSNAGQMDRVQLTVSRSRMEEAFSSVGAKRQLCSRRPMRTALWPRETDPGRTAAATSAALHTAGRRKGHQGCILKDSLAYWQCSIGSCLVMGCFLNTRKRRNADAAICGPPARQAQAACANFLSSRACEALLTDSVLSAAL